VARMRESPWGRFSGGRPCTFFSHSFFEKLMPETGADMGARGRQRAVADAAGEPVALAAPLGRRNWSRQVARCGADRESRRGGDGGVGAAAHPDRSSRRRCESERGMQQDGRFNGCLFLR